MPEICICENYEQMSTKAISVLTSAINSKPDALISFPGGDTPVGFINQFANRVNQGEINISGFRFVSLDEWVGLSRADLGSCGRFLEENLFSKLRHQFADVFILNGMANDIEAECCAHKAFIDKYGPITVSVLGIGLNGHLGFNEDGVNFYLESHVTLLSETTKRVMGKYFNGKQLPLTHGITQGIRQIMNADRVILLANGKHKAEIIKAAIQGPITNSVPASILQNHRDCWVILDQAAGSIL